MQLNDQLVCRSPQLTSASIHRILLSTHTFSDAVPGMPSVTEEFSLGWPEVLSSLHGVALAWIDIRSRLSQGEKSGTVDPRKLGSLRIKDQLGVIE